MVAKRPQVVIVGAGFGGLAAARGLRTADVAVTLGRPYGIDTAKKSVIPGEDATADRRKALMALERAETETDPAKRPACPPLSFPAPRCGR